MFFVINVVVFLVAVLSFSIWFCFGVGIFLILELFLLWIIVGLLDTFMCIYC